jgi:RNA polymerase sigma factor (TIGR02999 family)
MSSPAPHDITQLLRDAREGRPGASEALIPLVYDDLRAMAAGAMRGQGAEHTLQPTALVNEAWLKLFKGQGAEYADREHFLCVAARAMRTLLVDHARAKRAQKRGDGAKAGELDSLMVGVGDRAFDMVALDEALTQLAAFTTMGARIVELRFFGGLEVSETAHALGVSESTVEREWRAARAWLYRRLSA